MYNKAAALEILHQILWCTETIEKRFRPVEAVDDLTTSDEALEKLDSLAMQLFVIGECLKNLDKVTNNSLLSQYPEIEWREVKGMRDVIGHHYFQLDAEIVFDICQSEIAPLKQAILQIINDLS